MKCDFCKRDEDELKSIFSPLLDYLYERVNLSKVKVDEIIKNLNDIYGFHLSTPAALSKIDKTLLDMPIKLTFDGEHFSYFAGKYPALKYIQKYYSDKAAANLPEDRKLNELINLYSQEPSKEWIEAKINEQTEPYKKMVKDVEEKSTIFFKGDIGKISFNLLEFNPETNKEIHDNFKWDKWVDPHNIILCPYCANFFTGKEFGVLKKISSKQKDNTQKQSQYKPKMLYELKPLCEYFGVTPPDPDMDLLKTNYRKMVNEYHPDKVDKLGIELRNLAAEKTKEINVNYEKLEKLISKK
jgi:hypothetical protein